MGKESPCFGCVPLKRYLGCHDKCKEYQDWKASEKAKKDAERKQREQEAAIYASARWRRK